MSDTDMHVLDTSNGNRRKTTKIILSQENELLRSRAAAWEAVGAIASRISLGQPLDVVLNEAVREVAQALKVDVLCVMLLNDSGDSLSIQSSVGLDSGMLKDIPVPQDTSIETAAQEGLPIWALPENLLTENNGERALANALFLPLNYRDTTLGAICAARAGDAQTFSEHETKILMSVANEIAMIAFIDGPARVLMSCERMERDLHFAHGLKKRLLSSHIPDIDGLRTGLKHMPCLDAGGDFHDGLRLADGSAIFLLGETSGQGVRGALNVAELVPAFRGFLAEGLGLEALVKRVNETLVQTAKRGQMVSLCLVRISPDGRSGELLRVGNTTVLLVKGDEIRPITDGPHTPLGVLMDCDVKTIPFTLEKGQALLAITDGLGKCCNAGDNVLGLDWLTETLKSMVVMGGSGEALANQLGKAVRAHCGSVPLVDDVTVLSIEAQA